MHAIAAGSARPYMPQCDNAACSLILIADKLLAAIHRLSVCCTADYQLIYRRAACTIEPFIVERVTRHLPPPTPKYRLGHLTRWRIKRGRNEGDAPPCTGIQHFFAREKYRQSLANCCNQERFL